MDDSIYRMSFSEIFLVLIIIGLWLFAVINLARKLERICNPPSILPNYYSRMKNSLNPSTLHERHTVNTTQTTTHSPTHINRATSEPTIDASPRATVHTRCPSEAYLHTVSSISEQVLTPSIVELGRGNSSVNLIRHNDCRVRIQTIPNKFIPSQKLLNPKRIPSIVRRSLLDLHRRTLFSNTSSNILLNHSMASSTDNRTGLVIAKASFKRKKYEREVIINGNHYYKSKILHIKNTDCT